MQCLGDYFTWALEMPATARVPWRDALHETGKFLDANLYMDQLAMTDDHGHSWVMTYFPNPSIMPDHLTFLKLVDFDGGVADWQIARLDVAFYGDQPFGLLISCGRDRYCDYLNRFVTDAPLFMKAVAELRKIALPGFAPRLDWRESLIDVDTPLPQISRFYGYEIQDRSLRRTIPCDGDLPFAWLTQVNTLIEHLHTFWYDQPQHPGSNADRGGRFPANPVYRASMVQTLMEGIQAEPDIFDRVAMVDRLQDHEWWPVIVANQDGVFAFVTPGDLLNGEAEDPSWRMKWRNATFLRQLDKDPAAFNDMVKRYRNI